MATVELRSAQSDSDAGEISFMEVDSVRGSIGLHDSGFLGYQMNFDVNDTRSMFVNQGGVTIPVSLILGSDLWVGDSIFVGGPLTVRTTSTPAVFERDSSDGILVMFRRDNVEVGNTAVSAGIVSYNAFTGSHYAWTDQSLKRGTLVRMTGQNRRLGKSPDSEPIYGVERSQRANDPACMGAYLALNEPEQPFGLENPHLIMAAGNGGMWVTGSNGELRPGDALISSDVAGCAMKDDPARFAVGHVVARAAESVNWSDVAAASNGVKRKRISVLFGGFVRGSSNDQLARLLREQAERIDRLEQQVRMLNEVAR